MGAAVETGGSTSTGGVAGLSQATRAHRNRGETRLTTGAYQVLAHDGKRRPVR